MAHNIDSMAYYGEVPWHGLGNAIPERADAATMIKAAGLDWLVEKRPVQGAKLDWEKRPLKYELVRKARNEKEQDILLGLVSPRYEPLQNEDAFKFFDSIVEEGSAIFETAGALGDGERVWVLAKLPGEIRVIGDDIVNKYLLLSNTHNGKEAVTIKFTPIRVVCQNTLILALEKEGRAVKVRHTKSMLFRLSEVPELLEIFRSVYDSAAQSFQDLVDTRLDTARFESYLEALFPRSAKQIEKNKQPESWDHVTEIFENIDPYFSYIKGTMWAAYNAVTQYEDYRIAKEASQDRRLNRVWFGKGADLKLKAFQKAEEFAHAWAH
jgi:phage/plasmid-like protein (TIGR03299 family)